MDFLYFSMKKGTIDNHKIMQKQLIETAIFLIEKETERVHLIKPSTA